MFPLICPSCLPQMSGKLLHCWTGPITLKWSSFPVWEEWCPVRRRSRKGFGCFNCHFWYVNPKLKSLQSLFSCWFFNLVPKVCRGLCLMFKFPTHLTACSLAYSETLQTAQTHSYVGKPQQGSHVEHPSAKSPKWEYIAEASLLDKALYKVQLEIELPW